MKHNIKIQNAILVLSILFTSCTSCKKTIENPYKKGYYFYCKVDGKDFIQAKKTGIGGSALQYAYFNDTSISIGSLSEHFEDITIASKYSSLNQSYYLNNKFIGANQNSAKYKRLDGSLDDVSTDSLHTGTMTITLLDTKNKIIEGNFSFKAINYSLQDSINITDGKFSLIYE